MTKRFNITFFLLLSFTLIFAQKTEVIKGEKHLKNIHQLTFGGNNAEAYWSPNSKSVAFQSDYKGWSVKCDQIFKIDIKKAMSDMAYRPKKEKI